LNRDNVFINDGKVLVSKVLASPDVKKSVKRAVDLIGGFKKVISAGDKVIVKPNFNSDDPFPASSDPEFVKAVVSLSYDSGASSVAIVERSGIPWLPTKNVLRKMGMLKAAKECGAEVRVRVLEDPQIRTFFFEPEAISRSPGFQAERRLARCTS